MFKAGGAQPAAPPADAPALGLLELRRQSRRVHCRLLPVRLKENLGATLRKNTLYVTSSLHMKLN